MQSRWSPEVADAAVAAAGPDPADRALALRVYTSRLIGAEPDLVMHGGGNTSVKVERRDRFGELRPVLHVKGSGWDLGTIEPAGLPGVWLDPLRRARVLDSLSDEDMVALQRANLLDASSPNPSVETLLHAFLPHLVIDHTHATAMLALAAQPRAVEMVREIFGDRVVTVPYIMPGFALAKLAAEVFEANPNVEGLLLLKHGHFTFGADARESYERMIAHVSAVEDYVDARRPSAPPVADLPAHAAEVLPRLRGALRAADGTMPILDLRRGAGVAAHLQRADLAALATRGVATPDHVIRTKAFPLVTDVALGGAAADLGAAVDGYRDAYGAMFERQVRRAGRRIMLEPSPRVVWAPGLGVVGAASSAKGAAATADLAEQTLRVMAAAQAIGTYAPVGEDDTFDMEYWPLEQAKLGKTRSPPLQGRVVLITGGAGAIGLATARAFASLGAELFLVDRDAARLADAARALRLAESALCDADLTVEGESQRAVDACAARYGGLDILVSNAGAAWTGELATVDEAALRASFELNFWAHQRIAADAVRVFRMQGAGGCLLFNVSKQAVNPGPRFGPYGLPKAALLALVRQYALELGAEGIRSNGVNADRIRSGLLDDEMIRSRAAARGVSEADYMAGNLLGREVEARHVAEAFVSLALAERTTGDVMTVDGGNVAAFLR
ncbi:MAG: bifunctional aldolase/short-chain dehydrogenase [Myxococcales bacterium]|nr:bifunctional aldolase/short-chain dehydrogenase [Myxococcales bacterium]